MLALAGSLCFALLSWSQQAGSSASQMREEISTSGAKAVVKRLNAGSGKPWKNLLSKIESGNDEWLQIAAAIRPGVDAETGEDLTFAVATALRKNPVPVLKMIGPDFPLERVCDVPLVEPTNAQVNTWKREALEALDKVNDPALTDKVTHCRSAFAAIK
jgi:hypothetical protein